VDVVAVIASNDSWVMNAWGKVNGVKGDGIVWLIARTLSLDLISWLTCAAVPLRHQDFLFQGVRMARRRG
jgi:hypothetical protein